MPEIIALTRQKAISSDGPTFVIAEIGQNHQGSVETAKELIKIAQESGADCVKFQKTCLKEKFNKAALDRPYKNQHSWGETYGQHKAHLEFDEGQFLELQRYAQNQGILFSASAMDQVSLNFLCDIDVPFVKIGSGDGNNLNLIEEAAEKHIPLIVSTGMQDLDTTRLAYATISKHHKQFCLLQCISSYPSPPEEINLRVISLFKNEFPDIHIGYSGHEEGFIATVGAVAMGAKIVERHITLSKTQKGSDHVCSLEPNEFRDMIYQIRLLEKCLGKALKTIQPSEMACYKKLGKTLVASTFLKKGHVIASGDVKIKVAEPKGIDGKYFDKIVGAVTVKDIQEDESISFECLEINS